MGRITGIPRNIGNMNHYKNKECIHIVALYAIGLLLLDENKFDEEYKLYNDMVAKTLHNEIINSLSSILKTTNPYFGMIHLIPVVEVIQGEYILSLKIGYDKDYIIGGR